VSQCPLSGAKRKWLAEGKTAAFDPERTSFVAVENDSFPAGAPSQFRRVAAYSRQVDTDTAAVIGAAVTERSITATKALVARWVGIVSAAWWCVICSCSGSTDGSSTDAYRHSTAYRCTTINATAIDATMINASATNANASSICEGVSGNSRKTRDANDNGGSKRNKGSTGHDQSFLGRTVRTP
jgi:hypothetical protein